MTSFVSTSRSRSSYARSITQDSIDSPGGYKTGPRYLYYRLYSKDGPIQSQNPIYRNDPFIGRILPRHITPPHTAISVKNYLCNIEGLAGATSSALFESLSCQAALEESAQLSLRSHHGHGLLEDEPMAVVVELHDVRMRQAARDGQSKELIDADLRECRYVHYCIYNKDSVMPSKMSFIPDDNSLGRIDTLSIAPPHTVASLKRRIMNAEGVINQTINLFKDTDGEALMNETDHISFLDPLTTYPGQTEDEPIAIVCGAVFQENRGKDKERQKKDGKRQRKDEGRRREDSETQLRETRRVDGEREWGQEINEANHASLRRFKVTPTRGSLSYTPGWLALKTDEIMYTDGVKTSSKFKTLAGWRSCYGYIAINSTGQEGFVPEHAITFL